MTSKAAKEQQKARSRFNRTIVGALLSLVPIALDGQPCMGGPSFADRRAHIAGDASFANDRRTVSGSLSSGSLIGPFVSVGAGTAHGDEFTNAATVFTATVGAGLPLRPKPKTQFCPFIAAVLINGMESDSPVRVGDNMYPTQRPTPFLARR